MNITKLLNKVYFAPRLKEIELYTEHAGELQAGVKFYACLSLSKPLKNFKPI